MGRAASGSPSKQSIAAKGIVFDLDGTLIDSAPDIAHALNSFISARGGRLVDAETVGQYIGRGPRRLVEDVLAAVGLPDESIAARKRLIPAWR